MITGHHHNDQKSRGTKIAVITCTSIIILSIIISQQQIPALTIPIERIYDKEYIGAIKAIGKLVPSDEVVAAPRNVPQIAYFTGHNVLHARVGFIVPVENFGRAIIQYMWNRNCSYLIVPEDASFASEHPQGMYPKTKVQVLDRLLEKIGDYKTESSIIHVYRLSPSITADNIRIATDNAWPKLSVATPVNGTIIASKSSAASVINITGTAADTDSKIKSVEVSVDHTAFKLAIPKHVSSGDWSRWSISFNVSSEGTKRIMARATDNANHTTYQSVYVTIEHLRR